MLPVGCQASLVQDTVIIYPSLPILVMCSPDSPPPIPPRRVNVDFSPEHSFRYCSGAARPRTSTAYETMSTARATQFVQ